MINNCVTFSRSFYSAPIRTAPISGKLARFEHLIAKILQAILSKEIFCWLSRMTLQIQAKINPKKWSYWSQLSDNIYVGGMPLKGPEHGRAITSLGIGAILSINEEHELKSLPLSNPIKPREWEKRKVTYLRLSNPDLQPVNVANLVKGVDYVAQQVALGKKVYIHCNRGASRSVSVAICSLMAVNKCSLEEAVRLIKKKRSIAVLSKDQLAAVTAWSQKNAV